VAVHGDYSGCRLWKMAVLEVCVGVHHSFFRFPFSTSLCRRRGRATNYAWRCSAQRPAAETGSLRYHVKGVAEKESTFELCHVHFGNRRGMVC